jgi:hypothetical protein
MPVLGEGTRGMTRQRRIVQVIPPATWALGLSNNQSELKSRLEIAPPEDRRSG